MFNKTVEEVVSLLDSDIENGLSVSQVSQLHNKYWPNQITPAKQKSLFIKFISQFHSPIIYILLVAIVLSLVMKEYGDGIVIGIILFLNATLWFVQEYKADQSVKKLISLNNDNVEVIRDGKDMMIDSKELVPWDIVKLDAWYKITADMRIVECFSLEVNESALTWESLPAKKHSDIIQKDRLAIWDTDNMLFSGTYIVNGTGKAIVVSTGMDTELGKIAYVVSSTKDTKTPLEKRLHKLGLQIWIIVLVVAIVVILIWLYEWHTLYEMFFVWTSLAVSAIPEWLPAVVTLTLAIWVQQMYKQKVLVKQLKSIETLGSTSVICSDKTGTITQNNMTVTDIYLNNQNYKIWKDVEKISGSSDFELLLKCGVHCNNATLPNIWDPTELALLQIGSDYHISATLDKTGEVPFSSENKYMITHHDGVSYLKWAVENTLQLCDRVLSNGEVIILTDDIKEEILSANTGYARQIIRVLWFAYKEGDDKDYIFIGMMGMIDPPRVWVDKSIQECKDGGIRVIMITWDNIETAKAIARQIWLEWDAITGEDFERSEDKLNIVKTTNVFARVNPIHKAQICELLQSMWHVVAMTWDGVNDAAAIKKADVGISMAITGTDVTKEAADMLLIDDNFVSIVNGVKQWRIIYANMKKFVQFLLRVNFDEIVLILISIIFKLPLPFIAIQILWVNLVTDSLPAIALWFDKWDKDIMKQKPRSKDEDILKWSWWFIAFTTILSAIAMMILYFYELDHNSLENMRTIIVTAIIFGELLLVYSVRSDTKNFRQIEPNWYLNGAVIVSLVLHLIVLHTTIGSYFEFTRLDSRDRWWVICISSSIFIILESYKFIKRKISKK